jgi:aspartate racemase
MKRVGLVGGLGPESTIDYYRRILTAWDRIRPGSSPSIIIDSLDVQEGLRLVSNDRPGLTRYLRNSVQRLANAGVDFVAITANTAHVVFDELATQSPVPLLSIVEPCIDEAGARARSSTPRAARHQVHHGSRVLPRRMRATRYPGRDTK